MPSPCDPTVDAGSAVARRAGLQNVDVELSARRSDEHVRESQRVELWWALGGRERGHTEPAVGEERVHAARERVPVLVWLGCLCAGFLVSHRPGGRYLVLRLIGVSFARLVVTLTQSCDE